MQVDQNTARPGLGGEGRALQAASVDSLHQNYSKPFEPVALEVWKRNRWCGVGKIVELHGRPVLATVRRHQGAVSEMVSMPLAAIDHAEMYHAFWFYYRDDRLGLMWRCPLEQLRHGLLGPSVGGIGAEAYLRVSDMTPVAWRPWAYAERVIRFGKAPNVGTPDCQVVRQLTLDGGMQ